MEDFGALGLSGGGNLTKKTQKNDPQKKFLTWSRIMGSAIAQSARDVLTSREVSMWKKALGRRCLWLLCRCRTHCPGCWSSAFQSSTEM